MQNTYGHNYSLDEQYYNLRINNKMYKKVHIILGSQMSYLNQIEKEINWLWELLKQGNI